MTTPAVNLKGTDWQYDDEFALLKEDLNLIASQCRSDETRKMVNTIEVSAGKIDYDGIYSR